MSAPTEDAAVSPTSEVLTAITSAELPAVADNNSPNESGDPLVNARCQADEGTSPVYKFVLTGGPCAGKTTALQRMGQFLTEKGFRVLTVPEAATTMFSNGAALQDLDDADNKYAFQWSLMQLQLQLEDSFERIARVFGQPSILLCDRGLMDGSVYMPHQEWDRLVHANGMNELTLRDERYDGIFHLVTAAIGAEEHYSLENNEARSEPIDLAKEVDTNTELAWLGHPRHMLFDNSTPFDTKIQRVTRAVSRLVGLPCSPRRASKFLLAQPPPPVAEFPVKTMVFEAEKVFLRRRGVEDGEEESHGEESVDASVRVSSESFLEKRGRHGLFVYTIMTFATYDDGSVCEVKRPLSAGQHERLKMDRADPSRPKVCQRRVAFIWERQMFELHTDVEPAYGVSVLHRQSEGGELSLPPFLCVED